MLMDANGTRYHTLLSPQDWRALGGELEWNDAAKEVTLRPQIFRFAAPRTDDAPAPESRRGAGADRFGNLYWIDADRRRIRVRPGGGGTVSDFWPAPQKLAPSAHGDFSDTAPPGVPAPVELSALAVTEDHYLVAGTTSPPGLLVFDLFATGAPTQLLWPPALAFAPFDMAPRPGGGVWILDRANRRYWGLDRFFRALGCEPQSPPAGLGRAATFQAPGASERRVILEPRFAAPEPLQVEASDAFAIEALADGSVLILERGDGGGARVLRYRRAQRLGAAALVDAEGAALRAHDFVRLGTPGEGERLVVAAEEGNQAFEFSLAYPQDELKLDPVRSYLPMRRFAGKGLVAVGALAHYDFSDTWVPLVCHGRPRFVAQAVAETRLEGFDGAEPDCVWHRLTLDALIAPETAVRVESRAANSREALGAQPWQPEPALYRRGDGAELPWLPRQGYDTYELLFQRARGRFLQLRLTLDGNERASPRLRALRIWYPRFSYSKNYLPAVYREDAGSADFLERFLANFEGLYTALEDKVAQVRALFDWRSAPAEALAWLAGWFDAALDPAWDERRRRLFIKHAVRFFQFRGTLHGLRMALALALDAEPCEDAFGAPGALPEWRQRYRIVERFRTRRTPGALLGEPMRDSGPREIQPQARWTPAEGGARLPEELREQLLAAAAVERASWQRFLAGEYASELTRLNAAHGSGYTKFEEIALPADMPARGAPLEDWTQFVRLRGDERRRWQSFLARRYRRIGALNGAYRTRWRGFDLVSLFDRLPPDGPALADWYQFESAVKVMQRHAHRFSVLIPSPGPDADVARLQERLALARRVIELEKPAHTIFDVGFYWALFRVGEARLGLDTLIDAGGRALRLLPELALGRHFVGSSLLAHSIVRPADRRLELECLPLPA
jgi:phage tail-like protein